MIHDKDLLELFSGNDEKMLMNRSETIDSILAQLHNYPEVKDEILKVFLLRFDSAKLAQIIDYLKSESK